MSISIQSGVHDCKTYALIGVLPKFITELSSTRDGKNQ